MQINNDKRAWTVCVFCLKQDTGYSNMTVTGHDYACLRELNPALDAINGAFDEEQWDYETKVTDLSPRLAAALDVALTCDAFVFGAPAELPVEGLDTTEGPYPSTIRIITPSLILADGITDNEAVAELFASRYGWVKGAEPIQRALPAGETPYD